MSRVRPRLHIENLEDRCMPATFGAPWPDATHITISFVPDGTPTLNGPSKLFQTFNAVAPAPVWQREILRGIQTWLNHAKVNVGVMADGGQAVGRPGAVQGDTRYGDIRISAVPLAANAVANASPFHWTGTTLGGDLVFNSACLYEIGTASSMAKDIFSTTLHETGHILGLNHSENIDSVMFEEYRDYTGLGAIDIASVRELYGPRVHDAYDMAGSNESNANASFLAGNLLATQVRAEGDLTTASDVDTYRFTVPALSVLTPVSVRLKAAGTSLLTARLSVTNSAGAVLATAISPDSLANNLALQFAPSVLGGTYYVQVAKAADLHATGAYTVAIDLGALGGLPPVLDLVPTVLDGSVNDTLGTAVTLPSQNAEGTEKRFDYFFQGSIETGTDVDHYRITAPASAMHLNVLVWARNGGALNPRIRIFNAAQQEMAFQVLGHEAGLMSVRIADAVPGAAYIVQVAARVPGNTGHYTFAADFNGQPAPDYQTLLTATVNPAQSLPFTATISTAGFYQYSLGAVGAGTGSIRLTVRNAAGAVVFTLEAFAGQPAMTISRYLATGNYTFTLETLGSAPLEASVKQLQLSDPVGTYKTKTTLIGSLEGPEMETASDGSTRVRPTGNGYIF